MGLVPYLAPSSTKMTNSLLGVSTVQEAPEGGKQTNRERRKVRSLSLSLRPKNEIPIRVLQNSDKDCLWYYHYLPLDGMINIPIYLVWECWVLLNSTQFYLQIT